MAEVQLAELVEETLDETVGKYLIFMIGDEEYGIEISYITEIIGIQAITPIPEMPHYMKGIINLRGTVVPVMDVRLRFNAEEKEYGDRTSIIVVSIEDTVVGLVVDMVKEVINIDDEDIVEPPKAQEGHKNQYISGIGKTGEHVKLIIDCGRLFGDASAVSEL